MTDLSKLPYPTFLPDLCRELDACEDQAPFTPSELERYFLLLLQAHWSCPESFGPKLSTSLASLAWNPNPQERDILIELDGAENVGTKKHMLWLTVSNYRFHKIAMGDDGGGSENNAEDTFVVGCDCQILIRHEAPSRHTAQDMAWTTFSFLLGFKPGIMDVTKASAFNPKLLGEPQVVKPFPARSFRVDVGYELSFNAAMATTVESHILKRVYLDSDQRIP
jgi:hypothetical protein